MDKTDFMLWQMAQDDRLRDVINASYVQAQSDNIRQRRNLVQQFIVVFAGIVGFSIPVLNQSGLVIEKGALIIALLFLTVGIVYGFLYLKSIIEMENRFLAEQYEWYSKLLDEKNHSRNIFFTSEMTATEHKAWQKEQTALIGRLNARQTPPPMVDYSLDILLSILVSAILFIIISISGFEQLLPIIDVLRK